MNLFVVKIMSTVDGIPFATVSIEASQQMVLSNLLREGGNMEHSYEFACHPYAGATLIPVSFPL